MALAANHSDLQTVNILKVNQSFVYQVVDSTEVPKETCTKLSRWRWLS